MKGLNANDMAVLDILKAMKLDKVYTSGRSMILTAMIQSLGVEGAKKMAGNLLEKPAPFVTIEDCQAYLSIIGKAEALVAAKEQTQLTFGKAAGLNNGPASADTSFGSASTLTL